MLKDKSVLITGASSGIGEATAVAIGARKAKVTLVARRRERLEAVAERVTRAGGEALVAPADVRGEDELRSAFDASMAHWGRLDVLVNSAGVGRSASLLTGETEEWREMVEVNVLSLSAATREAIARFDEKRGGHIVHISSLSGHRIPPKGGFYAATKFAVRALTEALRLELRAAGNPTRVSSISPGFVATDFFLGLDVEAQAKIRATRESVRFLDPEDIAASIVHVLEAPPHVAVHDVLLRSSEQAT